MRTTTTLDPDLHRRLEEWADARNTSLRQAINELLRRGLEAGDPEPRPFRVEPHRSALVAGVDGARLNQLLDELEVEDFAAEARGR